MTQENNAADRAQNLNAASEETSVASNESFAQDWLDAEAQDRAEQTNVSARPRLVATFPDWAAFGETSDAKKGAGKWREALRSGALRTTGVATIAFGLGFLCAAGSWSGDEPEKNAESVAAVEPTNNDESGVALDSGFGAFDDGALSAIDSSTLRSVPNSAGVGFLAQPRDDAASAVNGDDWANGGETADAAHFSDLASTDALATNASWEDDSTWRRGVDFQREITTATTDATASVDRFPTWNDLGAGARTGADVLNAPTAPVAANGASSVEVAGYAPSESVGGEQNAPVFAGSSVGENAGYAAYNGSAGYQGDSAANLNGAAPQYAGNSQNSGYNQTNGSENFAGWPTTAPAPTATPNYASVAPAPTAVPNYASTAPAPTAVPNYASTAPATASTRAPQAMVAQVPSENASAPTANVPAANANMRW